MAESILTFSETKQDRPFQSFINNWTRQDEEFAEYLDGKSVAILGRAHLDDLEQGEKIDSYDVVVRMHQAVPYTTRDMNWDGIFFYVPTEWQPLIGKRTDIFYIDDTKKEMLDIASQKTFDDIKEIQFVCCQKDCNMFLVCRMAEHRMVRLMTYDHDDLCSQLVKSRPLKGTAVICDILKHKVENVYLTGFHCWIEDLGGVSKQYKPMPGARPWNDFNFLKKLSYNERVEVDPLMATKFSKRGVYVGQPSKGINTTPHSVNAEDN